MDFISQIIYDITQVHPLHTIIVHFPIALSSAALFFMLLALWRHSDALEQVAFANISLASFSTVAAGVTGVMDNLNRYGGDAPNANLKITLAIILFIVTAATALARWRNPALLHTMPQKALYVSGYVAAFMLVSALGFLGGVILYGF